MKQKGKSHWYTNPEMLVAVSALFIGIVTAGISIYSAYVDRAYARASVWPRLELYRSFQGKNSFKLGVANKGTGPAIVKYARITVDGKPQQSWSHIFPYDGVIYSHLSTTIIPSNEHLAAVSYQGEQIAELLAVEENLSMELCYCSIYDECWLITRSNQPEETERCDIAGAEAFLE